MALKSIREKELKDASVVSGEIEMSPFEIKGKPSRFFKILQEDGGGGGEQGSIGCLRRNGCKCVRKRSDRIGRGINLVRRAQKPFQGFLLKPLNRRDDAGRSSDHQQL